MSAIPPIAAIMRSKGTAVHVFTPRGATLAPEDRFQLLRTAISRE